MTAQQVVGVPLSSAALDSAGFVAYVCARTGASDHALSAYWPTVAHSTPMRLTEVLPGLYWDDLRPVSCRTRSMHRATASRVLTSLARS